MQEGPIRTFGDLHADSPTKMRLRGALRDAIVFALSLTGKPRRDASWIRFPYYHHVFDDERRGFDKHLRYMRDLGEFIDLDSAVAMLESGDPIDGRYFCLTFDDGFRNCHSNAMPILLDHGATAAFFLPTSYIGTVLPADADRVRAFYEPGKSIIEFLSWAEAREMLDAGMTMGSHTVHHRLLSQLTAQEVEDELRTSKATLEEKLGIRCDHFCAPRGRPGLDYDVERDPEIARRLGYRSFLSTRRGSWERVPTPMALERDHTLAAWGLYQLRYFLAR